MVAKRVNPYRVSRRLASVIFSCPHPWGNHQVKYPCSLSSKTVFSLLLYLSYFPVFLSTSVIVPSLSHTNLTLRAETHIFTPNTRVSKSYFYSRPMPRTVKVAVIGSGLAGLTAAYRLSKSSYLDNVEFEVHLFEKVSPCLCQLEFADDLEYANGHCNGISRPPH